MLNKISMRNLTFFPRNLHQYFIIQQLEGKPFTLRTFCVSIYFCNSKFYTALEKRKDWQNEPLRRRRIYKSLSPVRNSRILRDCARRPTSRRRRRPPGAPDHIASCRTLIDIHSLMVASASHPYDHEREKEKSSVPHCVFLYVFNKSLFRISIRSLWTDNYRTIKNTWHNMTVINNRLFMYTYIKHAKRGKEM